jgi:hypothetical protein
MTRSPGLARQNGFRWLLQESTSGLLFLAGAVNLTLGTWAVIAHDGAIAGIGLTAGLVLLFAATIDRFESLKGLGVEAKTRQLTQKIEEADELIARIKNLAELSTSTLVDFSSKMGRWDSAPVPREAHALVLRVREQLAALGTDDNVIRSILRPWALVTCRDLARWLVTALADAVQAEIKRMEVEQQGISQPISEIDRARHGTLIARSREARRAREELMRLGLTLDEFPEGILGLVDATADLTPNAAQDCRHLLSQWLAEFVSLRDRADFEDAGRCLRELDKAWDVQK